MKTIFFLMFILIGNITYANEFTIKYPLRGQGVYKWFFLKVYEAKLWAEPRENLYSAPFVLELKYKRNFKGKEIVDQSVKELLHAGVEASLIDKWRVRLLEIFPDVSENDSILASYNPDAGVIFYLNSTRELGKITDSNFSKQFLDIWLGDKTTAPELRNKLLGRTL